jgi:DNA helicase-2/ATP-dependent DNA helicase PcrA
LREPRPPPPPAPSDPLAGLAAADRAVVREEEALLARVQRALAARRARVHDGAELTERLKELRDEAMEATEEDLPTVFQEMGLVRAVLERDRTGPLPDARAPYFAHLRVKDAQGTRDYGLGRATFVDRDAGIRVVDWRVAPVAELFYRYREGEEFEETLAGKTVRGVVEARRVVVLANGALARVALPDGELRRRPDGAWERAGGAAALAGGAGRAARDGALGVGAGDAGRAAADVTALLDPDQYAAVTAPADRPLLVVGSAGSGKTTVALHRLARVAFADPRKYPPSRIAVVVPEVGLARLAGRLLEPLGQEKIAIRTVDQWARGAFQGVFGVPPPRLCAEPPALVQRLKRHPALHETLRRRPHAVGGAPSLKLLRRDLSDLLVDEGFLAQVVDAARGDLPTTAIADVVRHTRLQLAPPPEQALEGIDPERLQTLDGLSVSEGTPESLGGTLDPEDLVLLLFLHALRGGGGARRLSHLVVDEAEDLSLFEFAVLGRQLDGGRSVTVAGDESQRTATGHAGWLPALEALGVKDAAEVRLATTYRCPRPVAALAHELLGPLAPPEPAAPGRDGAPVGRFSFPAEAHAQLFLAGALRDLVEREPEAAIGVIAHAPHVARSVHRLLADLPEARLVLDGRFSFAPGIDVTDVESAKGLEWDYVVIPDASASAYPEADEARRRLHVAVTRAAHQLWIASVGTPTRILPAARP